MNFRYNFIVIFHISQGLVWVHGVISQLNEATALIIHRSFSTANVFIVERDSRLNPPHRQLHVGHALKLCCFNVGIKNILT